MRSSNVGGQAVLEGIMMKHKDNYAVAVRKPDEDIEVKVERYEGIIKNKKVQKIPILRGIVNFIDSMVLGTKSLMFSASLIEEEESEKDKQKKTALTEEELLRHQEKEDKKMKVLMGITVAFSIVMSIAIFIMLPYFIASILRMYTKSEFIIAISEAIIRILIFLTYMFLISRMKDIQRVFMYHGAEHKCINCIEHGLELNVDNVMKSSRLHKRCGTSFLLIVMIVSIIFFMFIRVTNPWLRVVVRLVLVPVIAGVSYEFIRLAGNSDSKLVTTLSKPGMALQKLTTSEPTPDMVEVAIASVEAVFDWKAYLACEDELFLENKEVVG